MSQLNINTPESDLAYSISDDLLRKGLAFPDPVKVVFNYGPDKNGKMKLATILYLADGTKTSVVNSDDDKLHLGPDGKPSMQDREAGIAHAIAKTVLASKIDGSLMNHTRKFRCYGAALKKLIDSSYDQKAEMARRAAEKAEAYKQHVARQKAEHEAKLAREAAKRPAYMDDYLKNMQLCTEQLKATADMLAQLTNPKADVHADDGLHG